MTRSLQRLAAANEHLADTPAKELLALAKQIDRLHRYIKKTFEANNSSQPTPND